MLSIHKQLTPKVRDRYEQKVDRSGGPDACHEWTAYKTHRGYGHFWLGGSQYRAPRIAWIIAHNQDIPEGMLVCHSCDNPSCVNPNHLWLGTNADNMKDRDEKGRVAAGARNGSRTKPERLPRGDRHWSRTKPDRVARGDRNGSRTKPDSVLRGETHGRAKLTEDQVRNVLAEYAPGGVTQQALAAKYGVTQITISRIINGQLWGHI